MNQVLNHYDFKYENGANACEFHIKSEEINCLHSEYEIKVENISYSEVESENENLEESDPPLHEIKQELIIAEISYSEAESKNMEESDSSLREIKPEIIAQNISHKEAEFENEHLENSDSSLSEIKLERRDFKSNKYVCYVCKRHYIDKELLESHIQVHLKSGSPYKCKICNKSIKHIANFKQHLRVHENQEESDSSLREIRQQTQGQIISDKEAESENENLENSDSSLDEIKLERREFKPKKYVCYVCKQHYVDKKLLKSHMQVHLKNGGPYKCKKCNKSINHISNFKRHIRVHTGEKLHECGICLLSFNTSWQLKIHQERAHQNINRYSTKPKNFVCDKCEKSFHDNGHLQEHMKFHGVREFDCQDCGKSYFTKSGLNRHVSAIHKLEKNHKCSLCDKRFGRNWDLKVHMIQHGRNENVKAHVVCDICNKIFSCQSKFKQHLKVHIQIE